MSTSPLRLLAPAKLTLSLRITGVRPDGYHLIDAEMVSLDLADELEIVPLEPAPDADRTERGSSVDVLDAVTGAPVPVGDPEDNLVVGALDLVERRARVRVRKRIPPGAGLGGGSSDAAAILRWAGWHDPVGAVVLGADVPFCLRGGRARVQGIGEELEPLAYQARTLTLLTPPFGCSTPAVYAAWDDLGGPTGEGPNDLETAALRVEPRLAEHRDRLAAATGERPRLAGSGSTWFVEGAFPGGGRTVVRTVPAAS